MGNNQRTVREWALEIFWDFHLKFNMQLCKTNPTLILCTYLSVSSRTSDKHKPWSRRMFRMCKSVCFMQTQMHVGVVWEQAKKETFQCTTGHITWEAEAAQLFLPPVPTILFSSTKFALPYLQGWRFAHAKHLRSGLQCRESKRKFIFSNFQVPTIINLNHNKIFQE